ncbi:MAG: WHG domain-containing protein [Rhizobiaceae bacterium]|nr:WHG domain-containing protein [Rhizobiaceae bacterium]
MEEQTTRGAKPAYHHGDLRQALIAAAEAELAEKGVEGFSLRGCARRAGVSHAAPAHHFGDTAGLLTALAADGYRRFVIAMQARLDEIADADPFERLVAIGLGYIDFARASPSLFRLMHSSFRPDFQSADVAVHARDAFAMLVGCVSAVRGEDATATLEGLNDIMAAWSVVHGMSDLILSGRTLLSTMQRVGSDENLRTILRRTLPGGGATR